jgi:uncharacterized caspase-like protein/Tfp pilus assembly protein PilF
MSPRLLVVFLAALTAAAQTPDMQRRGMDLKSRPRRVSGDDVPRGYALVIGVARYRNLDASENVLKYAESDAQAIHNVLISKNGGSFPAENVRSLIGPQATLANIRDALENWLPSQAREADRVVIFFAGHGYLDERMRTYLAPYDVERNRLEQTAYPMDQLAQVMGQKIRSRWKVLFADACHAGGLTPDAVERVNDSLQAATQMLVFTATRKREQSFEDNELRHGVFSYYLVKAMEGHADSDEDGVVTADEMIDYVRNQVREHTQARGAQQTPIENQAFDADLPLAFVPARVAANRQTLREGVLLFETDKDEVEVLLDDKPVGVAHRDKPLAVRGVAPGMHKIKGVKPGYYPDGPRDVMVYPGQDTSVKLRFQFVKTIKKSAVELYERGVKLSQKGSESDCREAVKLLRQALREQPDYAQAASLLGRMHQVLYEFEPALEYHRKAVSLDETSVEARLHYAAALLDLQDTNEAVLQINEALARAPRNSMAHTHLAHAYLLNEAYAETEESARRALALDHGNAQAHLWLGESLRLQKKFDEAKKNYQSYLALSDFDSKLHEQVLYYAIGMGFSKRRATQKAVHRDHRAIAYLGLCQCEEQMDRLSQAARFCGEALHFDPNSPNTYYSLGRINAKKFLLTNSCAFLRDSEQSFQKMLALNSEADEARTAKETLAAIGKAKSRCN